MIDMNFGFVKVAAAAPNVKVGDCAFNVSQTQELLSVAAKAGAQAVVFPELGLTGCTCADLFGQSLLLDEAEKALVTLLKNTAKCACLCAVGVPLRLENALYNCAVIFQKGKILGVVPKTFLSDGAMEESRYFASALTAPCDEIYVAGQWVPFGTDLLFACQDAVVAIEIGNDFNAPLPPSSLAVINGANIILNLSAANVTAGSQTRLQNALLQYTQRCCCGYVYASSGFGESSTDLVFTPHTFVAENGKILAGSACVDTNEQWTMAEIDTEKLQSLRRRQKSFHDDSAMQSYRKVDVTFPTVALKKLSYLVDPLPFVASAEEREAYCEEILSLQTCALAQRLQHTHAKTVVLGVSGGLDSTLALLVAVRAFDLLGLGRKGIVGITMPCFGTTGRTYQNSLRLMKALKITSEEIDIKDACTQHLRDLKHPLTLHDVTYENAQARERTQVLMDFANQTGALVIGTGDMSELALGWATYNGDHMSMYGVNSGIPKTLVRHLVKYTAKTCPDTKMATVLDDILDTPVSPELLPPSGQDISQKTENLVGPYELHDFFLYHLLRFGFSPKKIYWLACQAFDARYKKAEIKKWLHTFTKRFFSQQFKRSCLPDGPQVLEVSLSPRGAWRMPSDAQATLWLKECETL